MSDDYRPTLRIRTPGHVCCVCGKGVGLEPTEGFPRGREDWCVPCLRDSIKWGAGKEGPAAAVWNERKAQ